MIRITIKKSNGFFCGPYVPTFHRILRKSVEYFSQNLANKLTN